MNTPASLDPWQDAQTIAERLRAPDAELVVALGTEAWCDKCKTLRPAFEALCAEKAPASMTWIWLDLEDHAEFIGDFVPDDLPLLLHYRQGQLAQATVLEAIESPAPDQPLRERLRSLHGDADYPDLWATLSRQDWAC